MSVEAVKEPSFLSIPKKAWIYSSVFHLLFTVFLITAPALQKLLPIQPPAKPLKIEITENFVQVDMVALPDLTVQEKKMLDFQKPIVEEPKAAVEEPQSKVDEAPVIKTIDKKQIAEEEAKEREEELKKAMRKLKDDTAREAAMKALKNREGKIGRKKMAGNVLSKGTAAFGAIGNTKDQYTAYLSQAIKNHFNIFPWQKNKKVSCVVHLEIYPNGRVKQIKVVQASTDPLFDSAVKQAIGEAQPLPVPEDLSILRGGVTIEFKPE